MTDTLRTYDVALPALWSFSVDAAARARCAHLPRVHAAPHSPPTPPPPVQPYLYATTEAEPSGEEDTYDFAQVRGGVLAHSRPRPCSACQHMHARMHGPLRTVAVSACKRTHACTQADSHACMHACTDSCDTCGLRTPARHGVGVHVQDRTRRHSAKLAQPPRRPCACSWTSGCWR